MIRCLSVLFALATLDAQQPWWEQEPLRIIDLTTSISRIDELDPANLATRKAALGYNAEHLEVMGMPAGLDDRHFYFKSKVTAHANPDFLGAYMQSVEIIDNALIEAVEFAPFCRGRVYDPRERA